MDFIQTWVWAFIINAAHLSPAWWWFCLRIYNAQNQLPISGCNLYEGTCMCCGCGIYRIRCWLVGCGLLPGMSAGPYLNVNSGRVQFSRWGFSIVRELSKLFNISSYSWFLWRPVNAQYNNFSRFVSVMIMTLWSAKIFIKNSLCYITYWKYLYWRIKQCL